MNTGIILGKRDFFGTLSRAAIACAMAAMLAVASHAAVVSWGALDSLSLLTLKGDLSISGNEPSLIKGDIGVTIPPPSVTKVKGKKAKLSGTSVVSGKVLIHSGSSFKNTSTGASSGLAATTNPSTDSLLNAAWQKAHQTSRWAMLLGVDASARAADNFTLGGNYTSTLRTDTNILLTNPGNYVFNLKAIDFQQGQVFSINAPAGSKIVFNISGAFRIAWGSILVSGGINPNDVLWNILGGGDAIIGGGRGPAKVDGNILAVYRHVKVKNATIRGRVIAQQITIAKVVISPEF